MKFALRRFLSVLRSNEAIIKSIFQEDDIMGKIFGIKPDQVHEFVPKGQDDVPAAERTVFLVKFLDVRTAAEITDQVYTAKGFGNKREELLLAGTQELKILQKSLVGWKNFFYDDGTEVEWEPVDRNLSYQKQMAIMDKNLGKISPEDRGQIADFVKGSSSPDQD